MNRKQFAYYILNFVKLNPKNNKYPNFNKYDLNSFLIIQNQFKENKKYIITSNYDDIFYNKNQILNGKKWKTIFLLSKDIFELQKLMHEQIIFLIDWKSDNLNWKDYSRNLNKKLINWFDDEEIKKYFQKIENINLYRNTISKVTIGKPERHKKLFDQWNQLTNIQKKKVAWNLFLNLIDIMITNNLIKTEKSI